MVTNLLLFGILLIAAGVPAVLAVLLTVHQEVFKARRRNVLIGIVVGFAVLATLGKNGIIGVLATTAIAVCYFGLGLGLRYAVFGRTERVDVDLPPRPRPVRRRAPILFSIAKVLLLLVVTTVMLAVAYNSTMYFERQQSETDLLDLYDGIESDID